MPLQASEMRNIVDTQSDNGFQKTVDTIELLIKEAAGQGKGRISIETIMKDKHDIKKRINDYFTKNGFRVSSYSDYRDSYYNIEW